MEEHLDSCPEIFSTCERCHEEVRRGEMEDHLRNHCSEAPLKCEHCHEELRRREMENHLNNNCPETLLKCEHCHEEMRRREMENHLQECSGLFEMCKYCHSRVEKIKSEYHLKECPGVFHCERCNEYMQIDERELHIRTCTPGRNIISEILIVEKSGICGLTTYFKNSTDDVSGGFPSPINGELISHRFNKGEYIEKVIVGYKKRLTYIEVVTNQGDSIEAGDKLPDENIFLHFEREGHSIAGFHGSIMKDYLVNIGVYYQPLEGYTFKLHKTPTIGLHNEYEDVFSDGPKLRSLPSDYLPFDNLPVKGESMIPVISHHSHEHKLRKKTNHTESWSCVYATDQGCSRHWDRCIGIEQDTSRIYSYSCEIDGCSYDLCDKCAKIKPSF
eukprot:TRINITY_DN874_c0_g1_i2.p1 TRINITY_DN874_c0_g1~~TRINITY_DN874_c0_g1_i2.p1  ORF type:complete len:387 (+),score=62.13 TRINITY_DN874_c0_g1_i2:1244-2404(+)